MNYCYSTNEETYYGDFATEAQAIAEGRAEAPEQARLWVAEVSHPEQFLSGRSIGESIKECVLEMLHDEMGEACERFEMTPEQERELGQKVIGWLKDGPGFHCWAASNPRQVEPAVDNCDLP